MSERHCVGQMSVGYMVLDQKTGHHLDEGFFLNLGIQVNEAEEFSGRCVAVFLLALKEVGKNYYVMHFVCLFPFFNFWFV